MPHSNLSDTVKVTLNSVFLLDFRHFTRFLNEIKEFELKMGVIDTTLKYHFSVMLAGRPV